MSVVKFVDSCARRDIKPISIRFSRPGILEPVSVEGFALKVCRAARMRTRFTRLVGSASAWSCLPAGVASYSDAGRRMRRKGGMTYKERWIRAISHEHAGLFRGRRWVYALMEGRGTERRMGARELLNELVAGTNFPGNDAYTVLSLANAAFARGSTSWIGYPSGAEEADPLATNLEAVTLDMLTLVTLLRVAGHSEAAQSYEDIAMELRTVATEESVEATRAVVAGSLRGGAGSLNDLVVLKRDGMPDDYLNKCYCAVRDRLWEFAQGNKSLHGAAPDDGPRA
jgi:hypothetical protein